MSKRIFIDTFFSQFGEFMDQLIKVFPNDPDFAAYKMGLKLFHKTNPNIVIHAIKDHVTPFEATIRAKDEKFFLEYSFKEYSDDDTVDSVIRKLKDLWLVLTPDNKTVVWSYIILLLDLSKRCID